MEMEQELEWIEAQKIGLSVDLVAAAKHQLQFLADVDRNRCLQEGTSLQRAIHRYNTCWLPLLAKHSVSPLLEGPLVVPLDCEWIWHCHRLNPVRYKTDCDEFYGRLLDNYNVVSSVQGISQKETEEIWTTLYPNEPYELDLAKLLPDDTCEKFAVDVKCTEYNLTEAVKRQSPFFYQVSRPHMNDALFLEASVARYKGFLHLIKRNRERSIKRFCVPTYDIDLIWHSHQSNPASYCKDLMKILGQILEHDDMDSDRTKGKKLDVGFSETTKQWEETFGSRYWRAGAMYRGSAPSPITTEPWSPTVACKKIVESAEPQKIIHFPGMKIVEVMLEFVEIRNLSKVEKGNLFVLFSKATPDVTFNVKRRLNILSESGEKQVAYFQCQPTGHLLFEVGCTSPSNSPILRAEKILGSAAISLVEFLKPTSNLYVEEWLELEPVSGTEGRKPICLRVAISITPPTQAPFVFQMVHSRPFSVSSCFFPLPGRFLFNKHWTHVTDEAGNEIINLQMRDSKAAKRKNKGFSGREVIGITKAGESLTLAEFLGTEWSLLDSQWSARLPQSVSQDGLLFELTGHRVVRLFSGRKLEYTPKHCERNRKELDFMTAIEFSAQDPYGKAVALLDFKYRILKVKEEWLVLPGMILTFIFSDKLSKKGRIYFQDKSLQ